MNLQDLLRRLRVGDSDRAIARAMHVSRHTVKKYRLWAQTQQLLKDPLPDLATLHTMLDTTFGKEQSKQTASSVEAYRPDIVVLLDQGLGPRLIWQKLGERPDFTGSEPAVWRLVSKLQAHKPVEVFGRIETPPGEVAQVDFGYIGHLLDPNSQTLRKAWVFVMVLGWSRHMYAEFVFDQKVATWLLCHQHAFEFFGAVPQRVVLDNLKAAIIQAYTTDKDPQVQRAYAECAEHYGFLIDPCLPAKPEHKGKVERGGVAYIQSSFKPLLPANTLLPEANRRLKHWLLNTAGLRDHGTTHEAPLARFEKTERDLLLPLPTTPYDPATWKQCKLHRDGYVIFEKSFYSAPSRFVGQKLWLRAGLREIRLFADNFSLVTSHRRATHPGQRLTLADHLPMHKARGLTASRETCQTQAQAIGPATAQVIADLLEARPLDKLRTALRVLSLADQYTAARLEAACARGLAFGDPSLPALKRILAEGLDQLAWALPPVPKPEPLIFARTAQELAESIWEGAPWN